MIVEIEGVLVEVTKPEVAGTMSKFNIIIGQTSRDRMNVEKKRIYCVTFLTKNDTDYPTFVRENKIGTKLKVKSWLVTNRIEKDGKVMFFNNLTFLSINESVKPEEKSNIQSDFYGNPVNDSTDDLPF